VKELEATGKTIEEAKKSALEQLGVSEDEVEFTIIKKGRTGILRMGSGEAKIHARILDDKSAIKTSEPEKAEILPRSENIKEKKPTSMADLKDAKAVLEKLVDLLGLEAKVKIIPETSNGSPATLDLEGEDLGVLIGRRGQTLSSLQYIVRLIVSEKAHAWISLHVDIEGYKKRRYESLQKLALRLAEQVKTTRRAIDLEPMPPDERRIIHVTLADYPDIVTQSFDEGERRKVVIQYRKH
jgi:spoIIIJ-associated protein